MPGPGDGERRYADVAAEYGGALERLARAYERDSDKRRDLLQEIHRVKQLLARRFHARSADHE